MNTETVRTTEYRTWPVIVAADATHGVVRRRPGGGLVEWVRGGRQRTEVRAYKRPAPLTIPCDGCSTLTKIPDGQKRAKCPGCRRFVYRTLKRRAAL